MEFETWWNDQISGAPAMVFNDDEGLAKAAWEAALKNNTVIDCRLCGNYYKHSFCLAIVKCVNGDKFRPTTSKQIWQTIRENK